MPFYDLDARRQIELFPGVRSALINGARLTLSALEMDAGAVVPAHHHDHEQAGLMLSGKLRFRIGEEEAVLEPGQLFVIPGGVEHAGEVLEGPCRVLDIFSPVREDYAARYRSETGAAAEDDEADA